MSRPHIIFIITDQQRFDTIRALGYDSSRDVRARTRLENRDGRTRTIVEGWEGIGLRYRDAACRHRVARVGASTD